MRDDAQQHARDAALTRGLLMALSREPDAYFLPSWPRVLVASMLTLGVWPIASLAYRFWRYQKAEWLLLQHYSRWLAERWGADEVRPLVRAADVGLVRVLRPRVVWVALVAAVVMLVVLWRVIAPAAAPAASSTSVRNTLTPVMWGGGITSLSQIGLAAAAATLINSVSMQGEYVRRWHRAVGGLFVAHEHRPLPSVVVWPAQVASFAVLLASVAVPTWLVGPLVAAWAIRRHVANLVAVRQTLAARMLEVVDSRDGYRMEYDVEPLDPSERAGAEVRAS